MSRASHGNRNVISGCGVWCVVEHLWLSEAVVTSAVGYTRVAVDISLHLSRLWLILKGCYRVVVGFVTATGRA